MAIYDGCAMFKGFMQDAATRISHICCADPQRSTNTLAFTEVRDALPPLQRALEELLRSHVPQTPGKQGALKRVLRAVGAALPSKFVFQLFVHACSCCRTSGFWHKSL